MKIKWLILTLLFLTGTLCVLSKAMQLPVLELYAKPFTVPLFFALYWFSKKENDPLFLIVLLLCFLGDVFLLVGLNNIMYVLVSYSICYLILFYYLYKNHRPIDYGRTDTIYLVVFMLAWAYIAFEIYDSVQAQLGELKPYAIVYLMILYFLFIGAVFQYINIRSAKSLWFLMAVLNFVISDACFALNEFYIPSNELEIINSVYQLLAVFFLVQFKVSSPISLKLNDI